MLVDESLVELVVTNQSDDAITQRETDRLASADVFRADPSARCLLHSD